MRDGELESSWRDLFPKDILSELESDLVHMTTAVKGQGFSEYGPWGTTMPVTLELVEKTQLLESYLALPCNSLQGGAQRPGLPQTPKGTLRPVTIQGPLLLGRLSARVQTTTTGTKVQY